MGSVIEATKGQIFPVFELTPQTIGLAFGMATAAGLQAAAGPIRRTLASSVAASLRPVD